MKNLNMGNFNPEQLKKKIKFNIDRQNRINKDLQEQINDLRETLEIINKKLEK